MSTVNVSLRCLKHPATLASIALLLVNDHWLKAAFPSWWTGKLSDFAGLFFFPFLLAALLGLFLDRTNIPPRSIGRLAFGFTALWFASFKVLPPVNAATCALLGILLGHPVQLVLDPTDLIALPVLLPAWSLWTRETTVPEQKPSRRAWLALALGALATVATSPAPPIVVIKNFEDRDGKLYVYGTGDYYPSFGAALLMASSDDGGHNWTVISPPPTTAVSSRQPASEGCDLSTPSVCYRLAPEQVLGSTDGGKTYHVAWSVPWGRRFFMEREDQVRALASDKQVDMGPYDLLFTSPLGANGLSTVLFAMGNEGVLIRAPEGLWERRAVYTAQPTPFVARDWYDAFRTVSGETDMAAFLVLWIFTFLSFRSAAAFRVSGTSRHSVAWAMWPLVVFDLLFLIGWGAWAASLPRLGPFTVAGLGITSAILGPFAFIPVLFILLLFFWVWSRIGQLPPQSALAAAAFWRTVAMTLAMAMATWGVLILWTTGIIPLYEIAIGLSVILTLVVFVVSFKLVPGTRPATPKQET